MGNAGFKVNVLTNRLKGESKFQEDGNLTVYRIPLFTDCESPKYSILKRFDVLLSTSLRRMLKWADVVYVPRFWYSAIPIVKAYGKPVITHLHDYIPICPLSNLYETSENTVCTHNSLSCSYKCIYLYEKHQNRSHVELLASTFLNSTLGRCVGKLVGLSDAIICVSKAQRELLVRTNPLLSSKTYVIYNPLPKISPIQMEGSGYGFFGGPSFLKGFRVLCRALAILRKSGDVRNRTYATNFRNLGKTNSEIFKKLGIATYGRLDSGPFEEVYRQIRTVIVPSIWPEPLPYVVTEAILRGRLLIASRIGGIPEEVEGCEGAFLFEAGNFQELADTLEYSNSLTREVVVDLATQSREVVAKRFCNERIAQSFAKLCNDLL